MSMRALLLFLNVRPLLILYLLVAPIGFACEDDGPNRCEQDRDCREGYRCDLKIYVGECVQKQEVISCGDTLCFYPQERCVQEECVPVEVSDMDATLGGEINPLGGISAGRAGHQQAGEMGGDTGTLQAGVTAGQNAGQQGGDVPSQMLSLEWISPEEQSLLPLSDSYTVRGIVRYGEEPVTMAQGVSVSIQWLSALEGPSTADPIIVQVGDQGHFEADLTLPAGVVTLIGEVDAFGQSTQAFRQFTLDDFVRADGLQLTWAGERYRGLGIDFPYLLPWLARQSSEQRSQSLSSLWSDLRSLKIKYIRLFIGWTRGEAATIDGAQGFREEGIRLLDELIESATQGGVRLIFVLSDPSRTLVGFEDYLRWSGFMNPSVEDEPQVYRTGQAREILLSAMRLFPARQNQRTGRFYRDEPAILGWELLNTPSWQALTPEDRLQVTSFLSEASSVISEATPHQLLWTGELGFDYNPTPYGDYALQLESLGAGGLLTGLFGGRWVEHLHTLHHRINSVALDVLSSQMMNSTQWNTFGTAWLRAHALASVTPGQALKPLSVTYARLNRTGVDPMIQRSTMMAWAAEAYSQGYSLFTVSDFALPEEERLEDTVWQFRSEESVELLENLSMIWSRD